jgi:hypothetical protein
MVAESVFAVLLMLFPPPHETNIAAQAKRIIDIFFIV